MTDRLPQGLLLLQPTPFCNLDCTYCYLSKTQRSHRGTMSLETVVRAAEFVRDAGLHQRLVVLWHLGEPLVVSPAWYEEAQRTIVSVLSGTEVEFQFQTNATLITPRWVQLFESPTWRTHVSVSLDGPADLHDLHRRSRRGAGTHDQVMAGIRRLREAGVPFSCLAVITEASAGAPDRFYDFFENLNPVGLALSPEELEGSNPTGGFEISEHGYRSFLRRILDRWWSHRPFWIREVRRVELALKRGAHDGLPRVEQNLQTTPGAVLSVDWQGNIQTFSPELLGTDLPGVGGFLGNVHRDNWATLVRSPSLLRLKAAIDRGVEQCARNCTYFEVCRGGAPSNKWFEHGSFEGTETRHCRLAIQAPFDTLLDKLSASLA